MYFDFVLLNAILILFEAMTTGISFRIIEIQMIILARKQQRKKCLAKQRQVMQITIVTGKILHKHNDPSHYVTSDLATNINV